jgi:glycosyltransferase involved in cell wall biosynthesis
MAAARNTGLDAAIGKYFAFADSDDYMHPDTLKILHTEIEKGDFDIVTCDINRPKENAAPNFFKIDDYKIKEVGIEEIISFASVWGKLFRKSCFEGIKFSTDLFGCDDTFFMLCIHSLVKKSANVYMKLYYWRKNSNSAGSNPFSRKITISMERMLKKYLIMPIDNKVCLMALGYMFTYWVASLQHDVFVKWETFFLLLKMMNKAYSRGVLSTVNQCDTIQKRCCSHGGMDAIKEYFLYTCLQIHLITAFLGNKLRSIAKRFFCLSKNMC